jgi:rhodanese-related sulfurtransferase
MKGTITIQELKEKIQSGVNFYLVDAREKERYEHDHIPEALGVAWGPDFGAKIKEILPDKDAEIIVYGSNEACKMAKDAVKFLTSQGYDKVGLFVPGMAGWMEEGLRLESGRES